MKMKYNNIDGAEFFNSNSEAKEIAMTSSIQISSVIAFNKYKIFFKWTLSIFKLYNLFNYSFILKLQPLI